MKSTLKKLLTIIIAVSLALCMLFQGCTQSPAKGIVSIEKTSTIGLVDTYTIYYTDGSTQEFTVTNGKDGKDGDERPINLDEAYAMYKETHPTATMDDFLRDYLSITYDEDVRGIVSIEKTSTEGNKDTYTITFTDDSTQLIVITNGKDGEDGIDGQDGKDVTIDDIFNKYKETHPEATYEEFLSEYLTFGTDNAKMINRIVSSEVTMMTTFLSATDRKISSGSGIIYKIQDEYTYLITNCHVVYSGTAEGYFADSVHFYLYGSEGSAYKSGIDESGRTTYGFSGNVITASIVGANISADIAVIKAKTEDILKVNSNVCEAEFADDYHVGETAIAIGNSLSKGLSVTQGIVSVDSENITLSFSGETTNHREFRMDTALWHGNSGGGVFNAEGKLIGVANSGDDDEKMFYAVPLEVAKYTADNIMFYENEGEIATGYKIRIGVTISSKNAKFVLDNATGYGKVVNEITVSEIVENSIAEQMALALGDTVLYFNINGNGVRINSNYNLGDSLLTIRVGDVISFTIIRNEEMMITDSYTVTAEDLIPLS